MRRKTAVRLSRASLVSALCAPCVISSYNKFKTFSLVRIGQWSMSIIVL